MAAGHGLPHSFICPYDPVLLKPQSETGSQIIVQGKVFGQARGRITSG